MKASRSVRRVACAVVLGLCSTALAADWPMWGGDPSRNMVSQETGLPAAFEAGEYASDREHIDMETTQNVKWVTKMGSQTYGNPTVADGRVYVGTNNDSRDDPRFEGDYSILRCLDEETGEVLWTLTVPKLGAGKVSDWEYLGICSSPAIDGDRVYVVTNMCEVICLDVNGLSDGNDGPFQDEGTYMAGPPGQWDSVEPVEVDKEADADILWRYDMRDELGVFPHNITSTSPLVVGDKVYAATSNGKDWSHTNTPNPRAPALIALDKETGELVGEEAAGISRRMLHANWSSPAYGEVDGEGILFFGGGDGRLYAFNPEPVEEDGFGILKERWSYDVNPESYREVDYPRPEGPSEIIATAVFHKGKVYVPIGQDPEHGTGQGNLACVDGKTGEEIWTFEKLDRSISTVAVHNGLVYATDYTGFIYCLDAETGEQYWEHDTLSHMWGSPFVADGKLYVGNEDGDLLVFKTGREENLLNTVNMWDPIYSSPIVANGKLIVATQTQLYAIEKGAEPVSE